MKIIEQHFTFGAFQSSVHIMPELPGIEKIAADFSTPFFSPLLVCDRNTQPLANHIRGDTKIPLCILEAGESRKNWQAVETILRSAREAGIGRDGTFIGIGGGVVGDVSAFAASIYMRGCSLALVSTTLLGMVDASMGGKTGFDLFGIKNLAGTFYPARHVYIPIASLKTLPRPEWKSGMAELIKTAILDGDDFIDTLAAMPPVPDTETLAVCIGRAVQFKGRIVEEDPREQGTRRILLNLGHTFGHALEATAGLGTISHGEAVAWGIARSCDLALALGVCSPQRTEKIKTILNAYDYETAAPHPLMNNSDVFMRALGSDKKKRGGNLSFIVPDEKSAHPVPVDAAACTNTIDRIVKGSISL